MDGASPYRFDLIRPLLAAGLLGTLGAGGFMALAATLVPAASFALWHLVGTTALRPSSHYRKVAVKQES